MERGPERTCIGCRKAFPKHDVVRVVAGPEGVVIDYREKLPGRAAYVCPTRDCIGKALQRDQLSRSLRAKVASPSPDVFIGELTGLVRTRVLALVSMAAKAGKASAGYSAVADQIRKGTALLVLFAEDLSDGTREKILASPGQIPDRQLSLFTVGELGSALGRELIGVVSISDKGFSDALWSESERLKGLIKQHV